MKIALVQMTSVPDLHENINFIKKNIALAKNENADLVLFPENCGYMGPGKLMQENAQEEENHIVLKSAQKSAKDNEICVLLGSIAIKNKNRKKLANRSYFLNENGSIIGKYDKINMFDAIISKKEIYKESDRYQSGKKIVNVNSKFGNIGLSICFDIRFPELYTKLAQRGANIITIPSAFTRETGKSHWEILLKSRAIETSCWVLAPAQVGNHYGKRKTWGHSMVIDPWGRKILDAGINTGIFFAEIETDYSNKIRSGWGM